MSRGFSQFGALCCGVSIFNGQPLTMKSDGFPDVRHPHIGVNRKATCLVCVFRPSYSVSQRPESPHGVYAIRKDRIYPLINIDQRDDGGAGLCALHGKHNTEHMFGIYRIFLPFYRRGQWILISELEDYSTHSSVSQKAS